MAKKYIHLCFEERALIETQLRMGLSPAAIALGLIRARSTVMREIRRNGWQSDAECTRLGRQRIAGGYRSIAADRRARHLAVKPRIVRKLHPASELWATVMDYLSQGLSPAQITSTLARMPEPVQLSYETIYTALYTMPRGELRSLLLPHLRRKHRARRAQHKTDGRRKPSIPEMVLIDQRPVEIQMRLIPGHWEGDLIIGKGNLSQVGTLVERTTLFVALVKLDSTKADVTAEAFTKILNRFDSQLRRSMTYDQGSEMRHHKWLTANTGVDVYFAHPHAPWERGISENTNGLIRQYLPKGTDLSVFSQEQLDDFAWLLNTRPRKTLGWKAPAELFLPEGAFDFVQHWSAKITPVALVP
jgi:IS30 family transposase